jgi:hypothetical protein
MSGGPERGVHPGLEHGRLCAAAIAAAEFALDLGRVLALLPSLERARTREGPGPLLDRVRAQGRTRAGRSDASRARLARAIRWVDRLGPGGANCYRRTLLRVALDPKAAREPVVFGLDVPVGKGHAWVSGQEASDRFDVEFRI